MVQLLKSFENMHQFAQKSNLEPEIFVKLIPENLNEFSLKYFVHQIPKENLETLLEYVDGIKRDQEAHYLTFHRKLENPNEIIAVRRLNDDLIEDIKSFLNSGSKEMRKLISQLRKALRIEKLDHELYNAIKNKNIVEVSRLIEEEEEVDVNYQNVFHFSFSFLLI